MTNNRLKSLCLSFHKISINNKAFPRQTLKLRFSDKQLQLARGYGHGGSGGWGDTSLYKPYRYVRPQMEGFLRGFDLNLGIDFAHFGLESWFSRELLECMNE